MNIIFIDASTGEEKYVSIEDLSKLQSYVPEQTFSREALSDQTFCVETLPEQTFSQEETIPIEDAERKFNPVSNAADDDAIAKPYRCSLCQKGFSKLAYRNVHLRVHTGEKPYSCNICGATFSGQTAQQRHMQRHSGVKAFKCQYCDKSFVLKVQMREHEKNHTQQKETINKYQCSVCSKRFRYPFQLKVHTRTHTGEKPMQCGSCDRSFTSAKVLHEHVKRVHSNIRPYTCEDCGKTFCDAGDRNRHQLIHTGVKPFECFCGKKFQRKYTMQRHAEKKGCEAAAKPNSKSFICKFCDRHFTMKQSMQMHVNLVHGESIEFGDESGKTDGKSESDEESQVMSDKSQLPRQEVKCENANNELIPCTEDNTLP